ncbi:hypothetical protein FJO69_02780, partial [[Mycoplasma] falconis]
MTPDQLKKSILNWAISGKLTKQLESDTPVEVLLKEIAKEKQKLIDEKKIKPLNPVYVYKSGTKWFEEKNGIKTDITDQIPFEIPKSWIWIKTNQ